MSAELEEAAEGPVGDDDMLSVGSYITDIALPPSELRRKILTRDAREPLLDISGIKIDLEESLAELCSLLMDQNCPPGNNCFSFLYCDLGDANLDRLLESLPLRDGPSVDLSWNRLTHEAMARMGRLLGAADISAVKSLGLDGNSIGAVGCQNLFSNLRSGLIIDKLSLQGNAIGDIGVLYICEALSSGLRIRDLNIDGNRITDRGVLNLCTELQRADASLRSLTLSCNDLGSAGAQHLAAMLGTNTTLQKLDIHYCSLGDIGISRISPSLVVNASLKTLNVSDNDIGSEGAKALFGALGKNGGVETLQLTRSVLRLGAIGESGGHAVGEMLKTNKTLTSLE